MRKAPSNAPSFWDCSQTWLSQLLAGFTQWTGTSAGHLSAACAAKVEVSSKSYDEVPNQVTERARTTAQRGNFGIRSGLVEEPKMHQADGCVLTGIVITLGKRR